MKECSYCKKSVHRLAGHGFCAACYYREKRNGTPDYVRVRKPCSIEGCENLSVAQSLCEMHYRRKKRTGSAEGEHFDRWGHASAHPLYDTWRWVRKRTRAGTSPEWDDFWIFVRDVGERPSDKHQMRRENVNRPWGPKNFFWRPPATDIERGTLEANAAWMRAYRIANPRMFQDISLRRHYGIGIEEYERLFEAQGGKCAICGGEETTIIRGQLIKMAVDHDHKDGRVRGLLHRSCNQGIGHFNDDPALLRAAASYLERTALAAVA